MTSPVDGIQLQDCIAGMQSLPECSVDLVFADPPFNIGYEYDAYDDSLDSDEYLGWSRDWMSAAVRALKPDGTFWLAIGDDYAAELKVMLTRELGLTCRSWVIWYYTFGVNCKNKFSRSHTHLFHMVKDADQFTFNADDPGIRIPSARQLVYGDKRANPKGRLPDDTWILRPQDIPESFAGDEDTWYFPRVNGTFKERQGWHGCQMPEQLLGRIIRACSNPDELVMDPFTGSGTTLAVAKKLGRQHLGFELSEEYAAQASERLEGISNGDPLTGAENPLTSAPSTKDGVILGADGKRRLTTSSKKIRKAEKAAKPHVITVAHRATTHSKGRPSADKELEALIIKAFGKAHDGYSTDAVIANPELNEQFIDQCIRLGTLESPEFLNRRLMRLRKRGNFPIRASRTVRLDVEGFIYAGEITAALLAADHWSLDDVLCSPELAKKFDATAESLSPGFSAFEYRWSALHVRKAYSKRMTLAGNHGAVGRVPRFGKPRPIADRLHEKISAEPGLYVVTSNDGSNLFVGESRNLQKRIASQFNEETIQHWDSLRDARYVRIAAKIHSNNTRVAKHSFLISQWNPILNFRPEQAMATAL